jgi:hypothetical protein
MANKREEAFFCQIDFTFLCCEAQAMERPKVCFRPKKLSLYIQAQSDQKSALCSTEVPWATAKGGPHNKEDL